MRASPAAVISAVFVAEMAATFESAMIFGALPKLIGEYGDPLTAGWLVTMHMLVSAATYAVAGRLGDIRGRKQVMLVLIAIAACGSLLSAVTHSFAVVLAGRALQGFGGDAPLDRHIAREPARRTHAGLGAGTLAAPHGKAHFPSATGFHAAMGWIAAVTFATVLCALILRARRTSNGP